VVYEDIYDAKAAADHLSGFNVANRYLIVLFYAPARQAKKLDNVRARCALSALRAVCAAAHGSLPGCASSHVIACCRKRKRRSWRS
jgi:hypothetical protein